MARKNPTELAAAEREATEGGIDVLQLTDTHLFADPEATLLGMNTEQSLRAVLEGARAGRWPPDLVLATGDLVHDGSEAGYVRLREHLSGLAAPVLLLPGNHDERAQLLRFATGDGLKAPRNVLCGGWQIVLLDSTVPGSDGGHLPDGELQALEACLREHAGRPALICLHHPPVAVGSRWLDTMMIGNAGAFFEVLDAHAQVRAVLWGHIHQIYESERRGVRLLASPSTCIQFEPGSEKFALDHAAPGYRRLRLYPDGGLQTEVGRALFAPAPDWSAAGY